MKSPKEFTNDELALHLELWAVLNDELTIHQRSYFDEIAWRLKLMIDVEKENENG